MEVFGIPAGQDKDKDREAGREQEEGWERDPAAERQKTGEKKAKPVEIDLETLKKEIEQASRGQRTQSAKAAQEYMEDPGKVAPHTRHGHSNSFGTIGETFEERVSFWNDVTKHEREKDARTQIRLVLELPHEASPAVRQEIVKRFCQQYEDLGVPYWASIHAPTKKNDHRNHHAHVVHGIRPTKRMIDPETGKMAWDFTIAEAYRTSSRNKKYKHPYRQNVVRAFRDRDYVRDTRKKFAEVTNEVLQRHGYDVRYDARSYKDMGLDIEPMKHVSRVISDKAKVRDFVVLDAAWTKRLIEQEMNAAAVERDKTYVELKAVEKRIAGLANDIRKLKEVNPKLPAKMKLSPMSRLGVTAAKQLSHRMLEVERAKISQRFADESTARTIQHIIDSTAPVSAHRGGRARKVRPMPDGPGAPNADAMQVLHASAKEEMRLHRMATAGRARKLGYMAMGVLRQWQEQAQPKTATTDAPPPQGAKAKPGNARRNPHHAGPPPMAPAGGPAKAKPATRAPDFAAAEAMARQGRPYTVSAAPKPNFLAAEAIARQRPAAQARPVYHTPPRNVLEILERTSETGQKFPQKMHDYLNVQTASINAAVAMAREIGPEAVAALWKNLNQKISRGEVKPAAPETAAPPPPTPKAASPAPSTPQTRVDAGKEIPSVVYARETPQQKRTPRSPVQEQMQPVSPQAKEGPSAQPASHAAAQRRQQETTSAPRVPTQPTVEAGRQARSTAPTAENQRPADAAALQDRKADAGTTAVTPALLPRQAKAAETTTPQMLELEDMDLEALMRGRYTDKAPEKPQAKKILRPSDFQREYKPLTKEGNRPITQAELASAPPKALDPDARAMPPMARPEEQQLEPEPDTAPQAMAKEKRKKVRKKVFIIGKSGIER